MPRRLLGLAHPTTERFDEAAGVAERAVELSERGVTALAIPGLVYGLKSDLA